MIRMRNAEYENSASALRVDVKPVEIGIPTTG
jgi:hypothetical protein